jgi:hypothetical protein
MKRVLTAAAALVLAGFGIVAAATPAAAATPRCNSYVSVPTTHWDVLDQYYMSAKVPSYNGSTNCYLSQQSSVVNNAVKVLQTDLNRCYGYHLTVDGKFGSGTYSALMGAQRSAGLTGGDVDGVYGSVTRDAVDWVTYKDVHQRDYCNPLL